jgi:hypothetical protein
MDCVSAVAALRDVGDWVALGIVAVIVLLIAFMKFIP